MAGPSVRFSDATSIKQSRRKWRVLRPDVKPRALRAGDRVAIVAPASAFARDHFDAGVLELRQLGFDPVYSEDVFARTEYLAGPAALRVRDFLAAWTDPTIAAISALLIIVTTVGTFIIDRTLGLKRVLAIESH